MDGASMRKPQREVVHDKVAAAQPRPALAYTSSWLKVWVEGLRHWSTSASESLRPLRRLCSRQFLTLVGLLGLAIASLAAEVTPTNAPTGLPGNAVANLPVIFLCTTQAVGPVPSVPCTVRLQMPVGKEAKNQAERPGAVRFHGSTSQGYPKKSFALATDAPVQWLGLQERRHWVLNAAAVDRSLMRHKLSYDLYRFMSSPNARRFASSSRFVELNLNGQYQGVYLLMERVDGVLLGFQPFDGAAPAHACLYKAVDHAADFSRPDRGGFDQREPDALKLEYYQPLEAFNRFVSRRPEAEFFNPETGIASRLDVDDAMDFHLLLLLTSNMDGNDKNFMFGCDAPTAANPKPRWLFVPWDYDATFGRNWEASRVGHDAWLSNHLLDRLLGNRAHRGRFLARWQALRAGPFADASIIRLVDDNARTLGPAVARNAERWRSLQGFYPDPITFADDLRQMKRWIAARTQWLDAEIARRCGPR